MKWYLRLTVLAISACLLFDAAGPAQAQDVPIPSLINPRLRLEPPEGRGPALVRFLTSDDYPPFNFALPDGTLVGYNVDLARALCLELNVACTVQARRFDTLVDSLARGEGDVIAAAIAPGAAQSDTLSFTLPFLPIPARFAARRDTSFEMSPAGLDGRAVGVVAGSAHAAFLQRLFPGAVPRSFDTLAAAEDALKGGAVELVFGDGADLSFWLNGTRADGCCAYAGGFYLDANFFGPGHALAVRANDERLRRSLDAALARLEARGALAEIYLRYFPVPLF